MLPYCLRLEQRAYSFLFFHTAFKFAPWFFCCVAWSIDFI